MPQRGFRAARRAGRPAGRRRRFRADTDLHQLEGELLPVLEASHPIGAVPSGGGRLAVGEHVEPVGAATVAVAGAFCAGWSANAANAANAAIRCAPDGRLMLCAQLP